jgi:hypothetical protein
MLNLMLITGEPALAAYAIECGVQRIFVDLETLGKQARQGHRDTLISSHTIHDVKAVRAVIPGRELLVRVNPIHADSAAEIEAVVSAGADIIMLPMFQNMAEVRLATAAIRGRCKFMPLVETPAAVELVSELAREPGVDEIYVGLNDLHLALGLDFMFELVSDGTVERIALQCRAAKMPFGFGGIARVDEGMLPGELVLAEHHRLGSSAVILSRTFHRRATNLDEMHANLDFGHEIRRLRECEDRLSRRTGEEMEADHARLLDCVDAIVAQLRSRRTG